MARRARFWFWGKKFNFYSRIRWRVSGCCGCIEQNTGRLLFEETYIEILIKARKLRYIHRVLSIRVFTFFPGGKWANTQSMATIASALLLGDSFQIQSVPRFSLQFSLHFFVRSGNSNVRYPGVNDFFCWSERLSVLLFHFVTSSSLHFISNFVVHRNHRKLFLLLLSAGTLQLRNFSSSADLLCIIWWYVVVAKEFSSRFWLFIPNTLLGSTALVFLFVSNLIRRIPFLKFSENCLRFRVNRVPT